MLEAKDVNYYFGSKRNWKLLLNYWVIFIIIPFIITAVFSIILALNQKFAFSILPFLFMLFISPFFFFIPYRKAVFTNKVQKVRFILVGLVLPFVGMYIHVYIGVNNMFAHLGL
jgi:hypothetical protein